MTKGNIDLLLEKLPKESLAYKLVKQLKAISKEGWDDTLDEAFKTRLENKVRELKYVENQKS